MSDQTFLPVADADLSGNERAYLLEAFDSGWISGSGPFVDRFEAAARERFGTAHALSCANGTVALHLALLALGIGPGDEVIVPTLTYIATANAVSYCGATPVFADSDAQTWNITAATVEPLITSRTRAIIPVHLYGNPVDMDAMRTLAERHSLALVEDAAEAHGARLNGSPVGGLGDIATLSFFGNKTATTGEGGMVLTDDDALAARMKLLRGQGMDLNRRYWFPVIGYNYRLTNLQCAIGTAQMERLDEFLALRRDLTRRYKEAFSGHNGITFQTEQHGGESTCWMVNVLLADADAKARATEELAAASVETRPVFPPVHQMPPYAHLPADCPVAMDIAARGLSLPTGAHVGEAEIARVAAAVSRAAGRMAG